MKPKLWKTALARPRVPLLALLALLNPHLAPFARAQTWQTVDDFQYVAGHRSWNEGLVVAPSGTLFASGFADTATNCLELVFASQDGGTTWFGPLDTFTARSAPALGGGAIACGTSGTLYVGVQGTNPIPSPAEWLVRQGTEGGTNWATVDDYTFVDSNVGLSFLNGVSADAAGNAYAVGTVYYTNGVYAWTVRKGVGGTSWSTADSFAPAGYGAAQAVFAHPTAGVFVVGKAYNIVVVRNKQYISTAWTVRRSTDGGNNWSTVDAFQLSSGNYAVACGIGADANGDIYVVGQANAPYGRSSYANWVVRRSADGGNTWTTVDVFQFCPTCAAQATGFAADSRGNLFVAGWANNSAASRSWIVRENPGGNGVWGLSDNFLDGYLPHAMAADALGNIFVGGVTIEDFWIVRRN